MELLCEVCNRSTIENEPEYNFYLVTMSKKYDKSFDEIYINNNVDLDEVEGILDNHVYFHNKKFDFYFIHCDCSMEFDDKFTENKKTILNYKTGINNLHEN